MILNIFYVYDTLWSGVSSGYQRHINKIIITIFIITEDEDILKASIEVEQDVTCPTHNARRALTDFENKKR